MIEELTPDALPHMMALQQDCLDLKDPFTPTSAQGYERCYRFQNFCLGVWSARREQLIAFLCCTMPTARAARNLGRGRVPDALLDSVGHMNTLLVRAGHRGQGLGKRLMRQGIEHLRARGAVQIYAVASPENAASLHMLRSLGFDEIERMELDGVPKLLLALTD